MQSSAEKNFAYSWFRYSGHLLAHLPLPHSSSLRHSQAVFCLFYCLVWFPLSSASLWTLWLASLSPLPSHLSFGLRQGDLSASRSLFFCLSASTPETKWDHTDSLKACGSRAMNVNGSLIPLHGSALSLWLGRSASDATVRLLEIEQKEKW